MAETKKKTTTKTAATKKAARSSGSKKTTTRKKPAAKKSAAKKSASKKTTTRKVAATKNTTPKPPKRPTVILQTVEESDFTLQVQDDRHIGFYRNIAVGFFVITVLLFAAIFFTSVRRATVTIRYVPEEFTFADVIALAPERGDEKTIAGLIDVAPIQIEDVFIPSGTAQEEIPITGTVTIVNEFSKDQPLVKTTRLLSDKGVMYRLEESVVVPAGEQITDVPVYADVPGMDSGVPAGQFTIPGLWEPLQEKIYAIANEPLSGGLLEKGVISPEDMQNAEREMRERLLEQATTLAQETINPAASHLNGFVVSLDELRIERDAEIGDDVEDFVVSAKANAVVARYQGVELQEVMQTRLEQEHVSNYVSLHIPPSGPSVRIESYDLTTGRAQLSILTQMVKTINDSAEIFTKENFLGKDSLEVEQIIAVLDEFDQIESSIDFFPYWIRKIPSVGGVVEIVFEHIEVVEE